jgi:hypothetical protein
MLTVADLLHLPYTPDLTQAGIAYACRSLAYTYNRMGGSGAERLRRIVAGKAVELAFRRTLTAYEVPYDTLGATPFTDADRYDVALRGRRCDLKSFLIFRKNTIRRLRANAEELLGAAALVPCDQMASDVLGEQDVYIFAFVLALVTSRPDAMKRAAAAGQPLYLINSLPAAWARPPQWASLGWLTLKLEAGMSISLEIGGQGEKGEFQEEVVTLSPGERTRLTKDFYTLAYMHGSEIPGGRVGIHSSQLDQTYIIQESEWGNIWVYGMEIILAGYMTRNEFRQKSHRLPPRSRVWQYRYTRTENFTLPVAELQPLARLFERLKL